MKSPQEILLDNELVITMINVHHYVPHKDHGNFRQVVDALRRINPHGRYDMSCPGCLLELGRIAKIHLDAYKATLANKEATFHTFPKQDIGYGPEVKKHRGRKPGSKNKPK